MYINIMVAVWTFSFIFLFESSNQWTNGAWNIKFYMRIDYKYTYKFSVKYVYVNNYKYCDGVKLRGYI